MFDLAEITPDRPRPLRREEYDKLVELGFFEGEHVELLYGFVLQMTPRGAPHDGILQRLNVILVRGVGDRAAIRIQSALALGDSEPEPDVAIVPPADYMDAHPTEAWLVVEVAESSLKRDRGIKARLYAEHGVAEYWIVNIVDRMIEVHTDPVRDAYSRVVAYRPGETIALGRFPDVQIAVDQLVR